MRKLLFLVFLVAMPYQASALSFDCDVPADHYSTVSEQVTGPDHAVSGIVQLLEGRKGRYLPVVGLRLNSADESIRVALRLAAANLDKKAFDILLTTKGGDGKTTDNRLGQLVLENPTRLQLEVSATGRLSVMVGEASFTADFQPVPAGTAAALCSTGQFKFSALSFAKVAGR